MLFVVYPIVSPTTNELKSIKPWLVMKDDESISTSNESCSTVTYKSELDPHVESEILKMTFGEKSVDEKLFNQTYEFSC